MEKPCNLLLCYIFYSIDRIHRLVSFIVNLPASKKREWQVIDGQNFTFEGISEIWGLQDILKLQY